MPLSGGTSSASSSGGSGLDIGSFAPFPASYPNPLTLSGKTWLKTGTTALASAYASIPAACQVTYGADPAKHTPFPTGQSPLSGSSYTTTQAFLKTDGSSNMLAISGDGQYAGYSSNGGVSWTSGSTGIAATTVNDVLWFGPGSCWLIFTAAGIYSIALNALTGTLRQAGNFLSGATDGTSVYATQNSSTTTFYKSTNGTSWATQATTGLTAAYFTCIRYLNGGWVLVGGASVAAASTLYVAANGVAWSAGNPTTVVYAGISDIAYGGGYYCFIDGHGSANAFAAFYASLTSGAGSTIQVYLGSSNANLGSIAWNGTYFAVGLNNTSGSAFYAFLPNAGAYTNSALVAPGATSAQVSGDGSMGAFASGAYAGQFFQGGDVGHVQHQIYSTLVGIYIDAGRNLLSAISNLNFFMRVG
jgi:hypothetical protein